MPKHLDAKPHGRRRAEPITSPSNTGQKARTATIAVAAGSLIATPGAVPVITAEVQEVPAHDMEITAPVVQLPAPPEPKVEVLQTASTMVPMVASAEVTVQPGDTVGAIAARHGADVWEVLAANGLGPYDYIYPGQILRLNGAPAPPPVASAPAPNNRSQLIVDAALAQVGEWQDCVKMVADALATVGIYHYVWPHEYYQIGYAVSDPLPGDLIYYVHGGAPGSWAHIAIYIGNGQAVHGGYNGNQTVISTVHVGSGPNYIRLY